MQIITDFSNFQVFCVHKMFLLHKLFCRYVQFSVTLNNSLILVPVNVSSLKVHKRRQWPLGCYTKVLIGEGSGLRAVTLKC